MIKGFRDFIMRGNVIDLAVGVVVGVAFNSLIASFTNSFLNPLIKLVTGGREMGGKFTVNGVDFTYGAFITAVISFLLTAATLYFLVVLPMNKLNERRKRGEEPEPDAPSDEVRLLGEIRDALTESRRSGPPPGAPRANEA